MSVGRPCPRNSSRLARSGSARRLEELDRVPGRVVDEYLLAAGAGDDIVAEAETRCAEPLHLGLDVVDDEVDAVPATRLGLPPVGHRPPGRALGTRQEQSQIALVHLRKGR